MRLMLSYSATTYLHLPSFRDNALLPFHALAAFLNESLLSLGDKTFLTLLACAVYSNFPFKLQTVTTRIDGLNFSSLSTADFTSMAYDQ